MPKEQECCYHSRDGDSSSYYVNNTSEEEDCDKSLPEEEGITYISATAARMTATWRAWTTTGRSTWPTACTLWTLMSSRRRWRSGWRADWADLHLYCHGAEGSQDYSDGHLPILEDEPSVLEAHDQEEDGHYCPSKQGYRDCYPMEANGSPSASLYHLRCGDGDLEDQEEDINQIMAEINMNLSMTSITGTSKARDSAEAGLPARPTRPAAAPGGTKRGPSH
ncbi:amyloid-beta A4 precursor protein-binding family A member 2-like [Saimiri boliviensis]|uniref:amyloid-beta A4 precursor protein-binding family A member 2-like n=1 Tax=Saimiri boliviensis TaxID=27679 RepID=UPI00193E1C41|nr:amyloid-beta A4 precursor protein-binding family A member 2-like [Saimiri boliviensis boliviensis]XP_039323223.1 amyloid-beta A4 precursor protein-binding family A member 2-like [Saimiri boliviensis boliviensis]XP_039323224.1 amyloid-beta A4 precursor protein-binding family A member 2-like [Saimiri boliviensis boliviensis]XP_039323225.1 amyloid-beta A4 precursor protein-binding family A member 2-like [Saimiri boliviensis boliviensis]XP_039323226.1 amyloid-beta A4 precursor protein-binding fa